MVSLNAHLQMSLDTITPLKGFEKKTPTVILLSRLVFRTKNQFSWGYL